MERPDLRTALVVFVLTFATYALFAFDRLKAPSPHFHFVDLAHSFWAGRLDTDTPRLNPKTPPDSPHGYAEAIARHALNPDGSHRGWNDWASYRVLTMKNGEVIRGVFPWRDQKDGRQKEFHALDGQLYSIDCARDVKSGCWGNRLGEIMYYVSFPPWPAVLMMPLVKLWGYATSDVWFTVFFGALNGALLYLLLDGLARRGHSGRSRRDNLWLTCLFLIGSVHFFSAIRGEVWFTGLIVGVTMNLLSLIALLVGQQRALAGLCLGLAFGTRTPILFAAVLPAVLELFPEGRLRRSGWGGAIARLTAFGVPLASVLGALMAYNLVRFGSPMEFGHSYLQEGMRPAIREHGLMSGWFLPANLSAALSNPPVITFESWPFLRITKHGLGLLFTTPALLFIFGSKRKDTVFWGLIAAFAAVAVPGLLYQNTGWEQFGYRFGLDWMPYLLAAFAVGGRPITRGLIVLIVFGIAINTLGAGTFGRYWSMYY